MHYLLSKTEPQSYSIKQLQSDSRTVWDGIRNAQALKAIRSMRPQDRVFIYHSGGESAIAGLAKVVSEPRADPQDDRLTVIDYEFLAVLDPPVTLREIKETHQFDDWSLVRQSRLSTMAAPDSFVEWMRMRFPGAKI
jgi:predicted RNA-binding protein with PUA-like domain